MTASNDTPGLGRRDLFRVGAGAVAAAAATSRAAAQEDGEFDYGGWFEDVPNFEETADRTGEDRVNVVVGPGGDLVFEPPAVHVDPGTTVVWEWEEGFHNVAERESGERYASDTTDESGTTYEVTFEGEGISTYVCEPHEGQGMKGAVAVGSGEGELQVEEGGMQTDQGGEGEDQEGENDADESAETAQDEGAVGEEERPPAEQAGGDVLALFGVALVLAFLSPVAFVVLMYRHSRREEEAY